MNHFMGRSMTPPRSANKSRIREAGPGMRAMKNPRKHGAPGVCSVTQSGLSLVPEGVAKAGPGLTAKLFILAVQRAAPVEPVAIRGRRQIRP